MKQKKLFFILSPIPFINDSVDVLGYRICKPQHAYTNGDCYYVFHFVCFLLKPAVTSHPLPAISCMIEKKYE